MTTRSHKKQTPTQVPPMARDELPVVPEKPGDPEPPDTAVYYKQVLEKLDEIILSLKDLLDHMRGG